MAVAVAIGRRHDVAGRGRSCRDERREGLKQREYLMKDVIVFGGLLLLWLIVKYSWRVSNEERSGEKCVLVCVKRKWVVEWEL